MPIRGQIVFERCKKASFHNFHAIAPTTLLEAFLHDEDRVG
ncbi:hypothetical protein QUA30_03415 [Microcoleus sp. Pol14C2]